MEQRVKTLIVEKEDLNIELLKGIIDKCFPEIEIIGEARNAEQFINLLQENQPDLILLDIHLDEEENTLDLLADFKDLDTEIIILSINELHAVKAINEYRISGYMVKPINAIEFKRATNNAVKNILNKKIFENNLTARLSEKLLAISTIKSIEFIKINDIIYLEADGKYTVFYLIDGKEKVVSKNLGEYEKILPSHYFYRIHHKYIVNLREVATINKADGNYCHLKDGKSLSIAKRRQEPLRKFLNL
jgi:two-component system LytT family response regulator